MKHDLHRSLLILPANVPRFIEKAYSRGADAVLLDLEDSVPVREKSEARKTVKDSIPVAAKGGADVYVRVNNEEDLLYDDLHASIHSGLSAVFVPKAESADQIRQIASRIKLLEEQRSITNRISLSLHIESPLGLLNLREIAGASSRIESMSIGVDDYCFQLGIEPSLDGLELLFPYCSMITVCRAFGINPMGVLGSVADYTALDNFREAASRARQLGANGSFCIHPDQVAVLNQVFSPAPHATEQAKRIIAVFDEALSNGRASTSLDGKMVDTPIYKRAKATLEHAEKIAKMERYKAAANRNE